MEEVANNLSNRFVHYSQGLFLLSFQEYFRTGYQTDVDLF